MELLKTIEWINNSARIVDQTKLPVELCFCDITSIEQMWDAIKQLKVRGAPAIGVAAAFGLYLGIQDFPAHGSKSEFEALLSRQIDYLASSRPTAVNLCWALQRLEKKASRLLETNTVDEVIKGLLKEAKDVAQEDQDACRKIGENGFEIIKNYNTLLTHCNAGSLATVTYGTALSPIYVGKEKGKIFSVYADETRPLLQGARITAFELNQAGIPVTLICDNMAAFVMAQKKIDAVIVGADRIAANGDTANKIGTYSVALAAKAHHIPFYVAAPRSTFDLSMQSGEEIPIEERSAEEITHGFGRQTGPKTVKVYNPAFDVTPHSLITAFITEQGVLYPPYEKTLQQLSL